MPDDNHESFEWLMKKLEKQKVERKKTFEAWNCDYCKRKNITTLYQCDGCGAPQ